MNYKPFSLLRAIPAALIMVLLSVVTVGAQAAGTDTPSQAIEALVRPLAVAGSQTGCNALTGQFADCPITDRLRTRLSSPIAGVETGNLVSRSQNPPVSLDVALLKLAEDATEANVNTRWVYGNGDQQFDSIITFVVRKQGNTWLVDDSYCMGDPASSVYNSPVGPCPVASSTSTDAPAPGMPSTGAESGTDYTLPLVLGLAISALGLLLLLGNRRQASSI